MKTRGKKIRNWKSYWKW